MLASTSCHERLTKHSLPLPFVQSLISRNSVYQSLISTRTLRKFIVKHLSFSRTRLSRRISALPLSDVNRNGRIIKSVNSWKQKYYEKKLVDEIANVLCSTFHLEDKQHLQDFLAAVILSECVYKKVETSWENVVNTISQFMLDFPPGFVQIQTVQCTLQDVPHNYIIATSKTTMFVAFMGTKQPRDLGTDVNFLPEAIWDETGGLLSTQAPPAAHRGFHARAKAIDIKHIYDVAASQGKKLVLCGHSLGAAVAKLCTVRLLKQLPDWQRANVHCFGFAAPAVGNVALARLVERRGWSQHFTTVLMPEDSVMRLVSLAQQDGIPFNLVQHSVPQQQKQRKHKTAGVSREASAAAPEEMEWTTEDDTLSETEAATELAQMLQDEEDASGNAITQDPLPLLGREPLLLRVLPSTLSLSKAEGPLVGTGTKVVMAADLAPQVDEGQGKMSAIAGEAATIMAPESVVASAPEQQRESTSASFALRRRLGLVQLKRIARKAQGTWASAASRVMSRYMPFGMQLFLMPNLHVVSAETLQRAPQPFAVPTNDNRPAGPFAFHRMMSYRGRIIQVLQKAGGARLERYMAQPRPQPPVKLKDNIFSTHKITSAAAWLPLLAASSRPQNSASLSTSLSTSSLSSTDDDTTPISPTSPPGALTPEQADALRATAAARGPHGLGAAIPLPGRRRQPKTVTMMVKVDGTGLRQCRSFVVRVSGRSASFVAEATHVGEDNWHQQSNQQAGNDSPSDTGGATGLGGTDLPTSSGSSGARPQQGFHRPAWAAAFGPIGMVVGAAGKLLQAVLGGVLQVNQRLWGQRPLRTGLGLQRQGRVAHAVLRVQLPVSVVRKLHAAATSGVPGSEPALTLVARSDFHEVEVPVEVRANKVALLGTSELAPLFVHAAMSGQMGLAVGPGFSGVVPSWIARLAWIASLNPFSKRSKESADSSEGKGAVQGSVGGKSNPSPRSPIPVLPLPLRDVAAAVSQLEPAAALESLPAPTALMATVSNAPAATNFRVPHTTPPSSTTLPALTLDSKQAMPFPPFNPAAAVAAAMTAVTLAAVTAAGGEIAPMPEQVTPSNSTLNASGSRFSVFANQFNRRRSATPKTAITATTTAAMALPRARKESKESSRERSEEQEQVAVASGGPRSLGKQQKQMGPALSAPDVVYSPERDAAGSEKDLPKLILVQEVPQPAPADAPAAKQRWPWTAYSRVLQGVRGGGSNTAVVPTAEAQQSLTLGAIASSRPSVATNMGSTSSSKKPSTALPILPSKMHAGVLYELSGLPSQQAEPSAAVQQLSKALQRQVTQMSWFTGVWMALRGSGTVAGWQTTAQMMGVFGTMLMALPSGPLQFFNLVAENASNEHIHALMVIHTVGVDDLLLRSQEFARLKGLARSADVAIIPVVVASTEAHPGDVLLAQYSLCQACGVPMGMEKTIRVDPTLLTKDNLEAIPSLSSATQKQLGESFQDLWHHVNHELLSKQQQLVNIIPVHNMLQAPKL